MTASCITNITGENDEQWKHSILSLFSSWKVWFVGHRTAVTSTANNNAVQSRQEDTKRVTAEPYQDRVGQSFKFFCFWKWSVRYSKPIAKDGCPNVTEKHGMTV